MRCPPCVGVSRPPFFRVFPSSVVLFEVRGEYNWILCSRQRCSSYSVCDWCFCPYVCTSKYSVCVYVCVCAAFISCIVVVRGVRIMQYACTVIERSVEPPLRVDSIHGAPQARRRTTCSRGCISGSTPTRVSRSWVPTGRESPPCSRYSHCIFVQNEHGACIEGCV